MLEVCISAHFRPSIPQNQLEKENDQHLHLNVLITRACPMSITIITIIRLLRQET